MHQHALLCVAVHVWCTTRALNTMRIIAVLEKGSCWVITGIGHSDLDLWPAKSHQLTLGSNECFCLIWRIPVTVWRYEMILKVKECMKMSFWGVITLYQKMQYYRNLKTSWIGSRHWSHSLQTGDMRKHINQTNINPIHMLQRKVLGFNTYQIIMNQSMFFKCVQRI